MRRNVGSLVSALSATSALSAAVAPAASAAAVLPGGALDVTISGFVRFDFVGGEGLDEARNLSRDFRNFNEYDFVTDTEVHITARGRHDTTGIEYGGTIQLEADTETRDRAPEDRTRQAGRNSDETWLFVRGGFGEFRFGDTNSAAQEMRLGAYSLAVGTGGIDGRYTLVNPPVTVAFRASGVDNIREDATKIIYYSPIFSGVQLGVSYTPDLESVGDTLSVKSSDIENRNPLNPEEVVVDSRNIIDTGLVWTTSVGDAVARFSAVGSFDVGRNTSFGGNLGSLISFGDFSIAGSVLYLNENNAEKRERYGYTLGAAYSFDRYAFSISYGRGVTRDGRKAEGSAYVDDVVVGAEVGLLPGLVGSVEVARLFLDLGGNDDGSGGLVSVARLGLAF